MIDHPMHFLQKLLVFALAVLMMVGCTTLHEEKLEPNEVGVDRLIQRRLGFTEAPVTLHESVVLRDSSSGEPYHVRFLGWGIGPGAFEGALGVFDRGDRLLSAKRIPGFKTLVRMESVRNQEDAVLIEVSDRHGAGEWFRSFALLTLYERKMGEVFRCAGNGVESNVDFVDQSVELYFFKMPCGMRGLVRVLRRDKFASNSDMASGSSPARTIEQIQVFHFEERANRFVRDYQNQGLNAEMRSDNY